MPQNSVMDPNAKNYAAWKPLQDEASKPPTDPDQFIRWALDFSERVASTPVFQADQKESMMQEETSRYNPFPILNKEEWNFYKTHEKAFWTTEEIHLSKDRHDFNNLNKGEQHFIKMVLGFFAVSDGIVLQNLSDNFISEMKTLESQVFYGFQVAMENIHAETYGLLVEMLIDSEAERNSLLKSIETIPCIAKKAKWMHKWMERKDNRFARRLVAFSAVEGIFFSGAFCAIFWLKKRGLMPGLCFSNELISRDEGLHRDFACMLHNKLDYPVSEEEAHEIIGEAVDIEKEFITKALPVDLIGMNNRLMSQYIEFVADHLLLSLGMQKLFGSDNPFEWMAMLGTRGKTNFFEKRVSEYATAQRVDPTDDHLFR